jgi:phosphopantetheinyl transferase
MCAAVCSRVPEPRRVRAARPLQIRWRAGPRAPELPGGARAGALDVWAADLRSVPDALSACLSSSERERASLFSNGQRARLWARSRAVLRELLCRYQNADPNQLRFATDAVGKPYLTDPHASPRIWFNVSHSGPLALYALSRRGEIGVDAEVIRRHVPEAAIAARALTPAHAARLAKLSGSERDRALLSAWVRYEAQIKCHGAGAGGVQGMDDETSRGGLWVGELDLGDAAVAAVAHERRPSRLRCWLWPRVTTRATASNPVGLFAGPD